jgi:hypothetical protein
LWLIFLQGNDDLGDILTPKKVNAVALLGTLRFSCRNGLDAI